MYENTYSITVAVQADAKKGAENEGKRIAKSVLDNVIHKSNVDESEYKIGWSQASDSSETSRWWTVDVIVDLSDSFDEYDIEAIEEYDLVEGVQSVGVDMV
jgi:hypothetical protein